MALQDPTSGLVSALEVQKRVRRQIALLAALALLVEALIEWSNRDAAGEYADDLILSGFIDAGRCSPVARAVSCRVAWMEDPGSRQRLADALRWRVRLAQGRVLPSPGLVRALAYPPLGEQRGVYLEQAPLILEIAERIEVATVDPRALDQEIRRKFRLAATLLDDRATV